MTTRGPITIVSRLAGLGLVSTLALSGCSGTDDTEGAPPGGSAGGEAPSAYYDDYMEGSGDAGAGAVAPSQADDGGGRPPEVGPTDDNTFREEGVNDFVDTAEDARSTFGLDVDNGSFRVARSFLTLGEDVPPESVRPEEWINALPYGDAAPTDQDLGLSAETGIAPTLDDGTQVVRVGVAAREVDPAERPRVNVTLVVDRSGSMDMQNRLGLVQSSLAVLADELQDDDKVAVVSFQDDAETLLEPTPVSEREAIIGTIEELTPDGGTNFEAGLIRGYDVAREAFDPEAVNVVVICSDGVANIGETGPGSLVERIQQEGADGIHLVTAGFGLGNYNDLLMEQVADLGDGFYSYVDTFEEAERLFGTDLTTTLVPVAAEARAQVSFDPALVESYRLIGYENRDIADDDFEDLNVDAGELGSGHHATALYEVRLADGVGPDTVIGEAALRWRSVESEEPEDATIELRSATTDADPSDDLVLATTAADLAQAVKGAKPFAQRQVSLDDLRERLQPLVADEVPGAAELDEMIELAARRR